MAVPRLTASPREGYNISILLEFAFCQALFHEGGHRYLDLKAEALDQWRDQMKARSARRVWVQGGCQIWYVTKSGINTNNWPGPWLEYKRRTKSVKTQEYHFV